MRSPSLLLALVALLPAASACRPAHRPPPAEASRESANALFGRDSVHSLIRDLRHIATPEGIDTLFPLEIDGSKQWVSIRGLNRANPVLLFIHGGPGSPMMSLGWAFQKPWEDYFTVVQWDQRAAGKNFVGTDTAAVKEDFTMDRMVQDAEAVIAAVRTMLSKDKVVVLGFSWGSELGVNLVAKRPDLVHAYVGVGQAGSGDNEGYLYRRVVELATLHGNRTALAELEAIAPYPAPDGSMPEKSARLARKWAGVYNGGWYGQPSIDLFYRLPRLAPELTVEDLAVQMPAQKFAGGKAFAAMASDDLSRFKRFEVPILIFHGRYDLFTPFVTARDLFQRMDAPLKKFIPFERSSHFVMLEEPGRFLVTLVEEVLPLTREAVTFGVAPDAPR